MGNKNTKSSLRDAIIYLNISADPIGVQDDTFWNKIFTEDSIIAYEVVRGIRTQEIRMLRDGSSRNFATLIYKMVERVCLATGTLCNTSSQQTAVLNAISVLTRVIPCVFEDNTWRSFFEDNFLLATGEEPNLVYSVKSNNEKNYSSYLPTQLMDANGDNIEQDDAVSIQLGQSRNGAPTSTASSSSSRQATEGESEKLLLDESMIDSELSCRLLGTKVDFHANDNFNDNDKDKDNNSTLNYTSDEKKTFAGAKQYCKKPVVAAAAATTTTTTTSQHENSPTSLMETLIISICDLLFCPEFTVPAHDYSYSKSAVDSPPEDLKLLSTCDYVWEPGVGFYSTINSTTIYDKNRSVLLRLLLACISGTLYETSENSIVRRNKWIELFASDCNRHTLPSFTSFLNIVLLYKPTKPTIISNLVFEDNREELVELSIQILIAVLDYRFHQEKEEQGEGEEDQNEQTLQINNDKENQFVDYLTRIHRKEDLDFLVKGFSRLLGNRLDTQVNLFLSSKKQIEFDQELLILFWKLCNLNQKFAHHSLKSNEILDIVVPILYHLNENFQDPSKTALIHIGIFNLLMLSGERNFGVKLNKPYTMNVLTNLPSFNGSHADLLIIVFHKLIMYGHDINQLYDYLLTIIANISPYLKGLTILSSKCLIQLFETFTSVYVIFTEPNYHTIVTFLLEIFNNIIQYQFDGNSNLVYTILNKRNLFLDLINLPTSQTSIDKVLRKLIKRKQKTIEIEKEKMSMDGEEKDKKSSKDKSKSNFMKTNDDGGTTNDLRRNLATVSSSISSTHQKNNHHKATSTKQEVSLVATPDLYRVTRPTHPFETKASPTRSSANNSLAIDDSGIMSNNIGGQQLQTTSQPSLSIDCCDIIATKNNQAQDTECGQMIDLVDHDLDIFESNTRKNKHINKDTTESNATNDMISSPMKAQVPAESVATVCNASAGIVTIDNSNQEERMKKWRPTSQWLKQWKQSLPLQTVIRTIEVLVPQIEQLKQQSSTSNGPYEAEVIKCLQSGTLVGLLPVPHPILIRKYRTNRGSTLWFRAYTWGVIYVRNSIWTDTRIRLIKTV